MKDAVIVVAILFVGITVVALGGVLVLGAIWN